MTKTVKSSATRVEDKGLEKFKQLVLAMYGAWDTLREALMEAMILLINKEENKGNEGLG